MDAKKPATPSKTGRPKKPPQLLRTARVQVNFTPVEHEALTLRAASIGLDVQAFIRNAALGIVPTVRAVDPVHRELLIELHKIGVNLNQLTRAANAGTFGGADASQLADVLAAVRVTVERLDA